MQGRIYRQISNLNHNPAFFEKQIAVLERTIDKEDRLVGFVEGWVDWFKTETMVFATQKKVLLIAYGKDEFLFEEIHYKNLVSVRKDLNIELSEIVFVCHSSSISITNIENITLAREFYAVVNTQIASFKADAVMENA